MEAAVHETGQIQYVKALADRFAIYDVLVRHRFARGTRDATDPLYTHING